VTVYVTLPLFGGPGPELGDGAAVDGRKLLALADDLRDRLREAAAAVDRLAAGGWSAAAVAHDVLLLHPEVRTAEEARGRLVALGLDPEEFMIVEEVGEDAG
jgi:hypothetical protein